MVESMPDMLLEAIQKGWKHYTHYYMCPFDVLLKKIEYFVYKFINFFINRHQIMEPSELTFC